MKATINGNARVSAIGPCDALLGRGTGPNENQGNRMFRDILRKYKDAYRIAETKREKRDIVARAIKEFRAVGGRFIERVVLPSHESGGKHHCYEIVDGPAVSLKARQAFRYLLRGVENDDSHKKRNAQSEPTSMIGADLPAQCVRQHRLPTIHSCVEATGTTSLVSARAIVPSLSEHGVRSPGELTSRDVMDIQRLASIVAEAPMLASLGNSSCDCPVTSPWRQQELIPLSFLPCLRTMSAPRNPEMLLNNGSMRYPESGVQGNANTQYIPGFFRNEIIGHRGQYPPIPDNSHLATRPKLLDSVLENVLLSSARMTTCSMMISSHFRNLVVSADQLLSAQHEEESRIIEQQRAVARALIEQCLGQNHLAALAVPDLQRIMMRDNQETSPSFSFMLDLENNKSQHHQRQGGTTFLHQIMTGQLPAGDTGGVLFPK